MAAGRRTPPGRRRCREKDRREKGPGPAGSSAVYGPAGRLRPVPGHHDRLRPGRGLPAGQGQGQDLRDPGLHAGPAEAERGPLRAGDLGQRGRGEDAAGGQGPGPVTADPGQGPGPDRDQPQCHADQGRGAADGGGRSGLLRGLLRGGEKISGPGREGPAQDVPGVCPRGQDVEKPGGFGRGDLRGLLQEYPVRPQHPLLAEGQPEEGGGRPGCPRLRPVLPECL